MSLGTTAPARKEYVFDDERQEKLLSILLDVNSLPLYHPKVQAWRPFFLSYLSAGITPELTSSYYASLFEKYNPLDIPKNKYSAFYRDILKTRSTSDYDLFHPYMFSDLEYIRDVICYFFIEHRKTITKRIHSKELYGNVFSMLLNQNDWDGTSCAINLYRHAQIEEFDYDNVIHDELQDRLRDWIVEFSDEFDSVVEFLGDKLYLYSWYNEDVKTVICNAWNTALMIRNRPLYMDVQIASKFDDMILTKLTRTVEFSPVMFDIPFRPQKVWDTMCNAFYPANPNDPKGTVKYFHVFEVPKSYIKRMTDFLSTFLGILEGNTLTKYLYAQKQASFVNNENDTETPEEFLNDLYVRGFPRI